jgi:tetratricopeptide (TPR) repeat protein
MPKLAAILKRTLAGKVSSEARRLSLFLAVILTVSLGCYWLTALLIHSDYTPDMAVDKDGNYYLVYSHEAEIRKFSPDGKLLMTFGGGGRENGKFRRSGGLDLVAVDPKGNVYAGQLDYDKPGVIQKFDAQGRFLQKWQFSDMEMLDLTVDSASNLYVLLREDYSNYYVQKYDSQGKLTTWYGSSLQVSDLTPERLIITPKDTILFADYHYSSLTGRSVYKLCEFSNDGKLLAVRFYDGLDISDLIATDTDGNLYTGKYSNTIYKRASDGTVLNTWAEETDRMYDYIAAFTLDSQNNIYYITNNVDQIVKKLDAQDNLVSQWTYSESRPFDFFFYLLLIATPIATAFLLAKKLGYLSGFLSVAQAKVSLPTTISRDSLDLRKLGKISSIKISLKNLVVLVIAPGLLLVPIAAQIALFHLTGGEPINQAYAWGGAGILSLLVMFFIICLFGQAISDDHLYHSYYLSTIRQVLDDVAASVFVPKKGFSKIYRGLRCNPSLSLWWVNRAFRRGDYERALQRATKLRRFNKSPLLRQKQIECLLQLDRLLEAEYLIQEALTSVDAKRASNLAEILSWLAFVRQKQARYAESLYIAQEALELNPSNYASARLMAESYLLSGVHPDRALELLNYAKKHYKSFGFKGWTYHYNPLIEVNVAWALAQTGEFIEADKLVKAIEAKLAKQTKKALLPYVSTLYSRIDEIEKLQSTKGLAGHSDRA